MNKYFFIITSAFVLLIIDFLYLNLIKNYFYKQIRLVQGTNPTINIFGVILCYIFLVFGLNYFILNKNKSVLDAFLLGIIIYGVYETTNYSLLKNWSIVTVIMDTLWGGILFALTTFIMKKMS
jgi:uncharacterized membrane protein